MSIFPEARSDALDARFREFFASRYVPPKRGVLLIGTIVVLILLSNVAQFVILYQLSRSNHSVLTSQIPGLKAQIAVRDRTISDQQFELQTAVDYIIKFSKKIEALGGKPGRVEIKPPSH